MAVKISFLGMPNMVGRSAYLISGTKNILLDYGVDLDKTPKFPKPVSVTDLDLLIISHSHLDHMGASPMLYITGEADAYMTPPTLEISDLLIRDFMKLSGEYLPFEYIDFISLRRRTRLVKYGKEYDIDGAKIRFLDAGHIPGSAQISLEMDGRRILYTGDINTYETQLINPADLEYPYEYDAVLIETTYGDRKHPDRRETEKRFVELASETIEEGGVVLVPAFAVARSQEILLVLDKYNFKYPIVMDGMALEVTKIFMSMGRYLKDVKRLRRAFNRVRKIYKWRERKKVIREPCLIIAPAGMLGGGAAVFYLNKLIGNPKNRIFLVGYQAPGSPGRNLLEESREEGERDKAEVLYMSFSAHADAEGLVKVLRAIPGDPKLFVVHGDENARRNIGEIARDELGYKVYYPSHGEVVRI